MNPYAKCIGLVGVLSLFIGIRTSDPSPPIADTRAVPGAIPTSQENDVGRVRVAGGEYQTLQEGNEGGIGPYVPGVYNFHESWTLWRLLDGSFEAEGKREYESPKGEQQGNSFSVHLAPDFRTLGMKEFRKLRWRQDSGPLTCEFQPARLVCTSGAKDPNQAVNLDMPMNGAYGFLWPISAFSLSNITRNAEKVPRKLTPVQLVTVEEPSKENPVFVSTLDGHLKYIGQEEVVQAGKTWRADKFELKIPLHPPFIIWTSPEGLLLGFAPETGTEIPAESGLWLFHFQQWANF